MSASSRIKLFAWGLSGVVVLLAIIAWGETYSWRFANFGIYQLFPVLGLTAFSLMWGHYVAAAVRMYSGVDKAALKQYFELTSAAVLTLIILHPGLLAWQLWVDGQGLPPGSELNFVAPSARWAIWFAFAALVFFLAYELRRYFGQKPWWKYIQYLSDVAMVLIFFHALRLGGALQLPWFRGIWYFYGLAYVAALLYMYWPKPKQQ